MLIDIHLAETAIKAGDTKTGFEILREILATDPDSERAWWVMSGLVQREQRAICLEQVLRINPKNTFALDALENLMFAPQEPETKPLREIPLPAREEIPPVQEPAPIEEVPAPEPPPLEATPAPESTAAEPDPAPDPEPEEESVLQTWLDARGSKFFLTILGPKHITRALTDSTLFSKVRAELKKGQIPDKLLAEMQTLPLTSVTSVKQLKSGLLVFYQDGVSERSMRLHLADQQAVQKMLRTLKERLSPNFILKTRPTKTGLTLGISTVITVGAAVLTAYSFWLTQEVVSGRAASTGSVKSEFLINLVWSLGAGGVILIGAFTLLVALAISAWLMLKPPTITTLERRP